MKEYGWIFAYFFKTEDYKYWGTKVLRTISIEEYIIIEQWAVLNALILDLM